MVDLKVATNSGTGGVLEEAKVEELKSELRGEVRQPGDDGYDEARKVWNGLIDKRPALIASCTGVADVITAVNFAQTNNLLLAVRGGGHSWPGHSVCDDGLVIDLSPMKGIQVDVANRTARAQGGATWGDLDHETQAFGLATPGGVVSTTGIGGLTLGGGSQCWLIRKYGTAVDNLVSVDVVTADGSFVRANASENEDLFWAVRGGGGNFGVVTSFEYQLHPVGPLVLAGPAFYPWNRAKEVTQFYLDFVKGIPDELTTMLLYWTAPPAPFLPESAHGRKFAIIAVCYSGPADEFAVWLDEISEAAIDEMVARADKKPAPLSLAHLNHFGGAVARVPNDATAFAHRDSTFAFSFDSFWDDPSQSEINLRWTKESWEAMRAYSPRGAYVNFMDDEGEDRVKESYRGNYDRLVEIKNKYDPTNLFRLNQNIKPTA